MFVLFCACDVMNVLSVKKNENIPKKKKKIKKNWDMGKSSVSSTQRRAMMATLVKMLTSVPIVRNLIWPPLKTVNSS